MEAWVYDLVVPGLPVKLGHDGLLQHAQLAQGLRYALQSRLPALHQMNEDVEASLPDVVAVDLDAAFRKKLDRQRVFDLDQPIEVGVLVQPKLDDELVHGSAFHGGLVAALQDAMLRPLPPPFN